MISAIAIRFIDWAGRLIDMREPAYFPAVQPTEWRMPHLNVLEIRLARDRQPRQSRARGDRSWIDVRKQLPVVRCVLLGVRDLSCQIARFGVLPLGYRSHFEFIVVLAIFAHGDTSPHQASQRFRRR